MIEITGELPGMTEELPWSTLTEAAERSGLNRETLRSRVRRGLITSRRGNAGQLLVQLPGELTGFTRVDQGITGVMTAPDQGITEALDELREEIADLRARVIRAEMERERAREVAEAKLAGKDEVLAEMRAELARHRQPWWRRLLG